MIKLIATELIERAVEAEAVKTVRLMIRTLTELLRKMTRQYLHQINNLIN